MSGSPKMPNTTKKSARRDTESSWNADPNIFTELIATHSFRKYHNLCLEHSPRTPLYNVVSRSPLTQAFDVELHEGADKDGPTLGVVRLHIKKHEIGIGDPSYIIEEDRDPRMRMVWETLSKPVLFSTKEFFFDYGEGKERKSYVWRRVRDLFPRPFTDMELWEVAKEKGNGDRDGDGLPLAIWKKNSTWGPRLKEGSFFLRRAPGTEGEDDVAAKKWELMVLLTALALLEMAVRRKRG